MASDTPPLPRSASQPPAPGFGAPPRLPLAPRTKSARWAATLNLLLPGAGLFYLGHRKLGAVIAIAFLICLAAALFIFITWYAHYLDVVLGGDLMKEGQIEHLADGLHKNVLAGLLVVGLGLQVFSMFALSRRRREMEAQGVPQ